eukprot:TRINITY_DN80087_c0_g1_i1.p1 TRINITY_DN80087_c0_g1~~TRINITY_DN80087_c0_g1_i1.p1  ORF type:complete len:131 (-),score=33.55 TRINITY_DN80087_c0_g1_i1:36-428(-)
MLQVPNGSTEVTLEVLDMEKTAPPKGRGLKVKILSLNLYVEGDTCSEFLKRTRPPSPSPSPAPTVAPPIIDVEFDRGEDTVLERILALIMPAAVVTFLLLIFRTYFRVNGWRSLRNLSQRADLQQIQPQR